MSGTNQPSFKVDLNRNKTKKWVEAPTYDYGGDDWEVADEYGEYDGPADNPAPVPPPQTGFRQYGQTASVPTSRGPTQPSTSSIPAAPAPLQRVNSYEAGDERETFSSVTSPAVAQGEALEQFPRHSVDQRATSRHTQSEQSYEDFQSAPQSVRHSSDIQPAYSQQPPRFDSPQPEPSHEPEYDERDYPSHPSQAGLGVPMQQDNQNPRHSYLPPLRSEIEAGAYHYPLANQTRSLPFPPRKSSLSSRSRPDLHELYQAQAPQQDAGYGSPRFSGQVDSFQAGTAQRQDLGAAGEQDAQAVATPRFIRPADIYKRMAEEKEKERQSMESARNSPERPQVVAATPEPPFQASTHSPIELPAEVRLPRQQSTSSISPEAPLPPDEPTHAQQPVNQEVASSLPLPGDDSQRQSELSSSYVQSGQSSTSPTLLPGLSISNPMLARALGVGVQDSDAAQDPTQSTTKSPTLPSISRFSGFGSLSDGIWQSQTADREGPESATTAELPSAEPEKRVQSYDGPANDTASSTRRYQEEQPRNNWNQPVAQTLLAHERNASEEGPLSSPTAYYFSQHAGSLDDRLYDSTQEEEPYPSQYHTAHAASHQSSDSIAHRKAPATEEVNTQVPTEREVNVPEPLPEASSAISREELEENLSGNSRGTLGDSGNFEHARAKDTANQAATDDVSEQHLRTADADIDTEEPAYRYDVDAPSAQHDTTTDDGLKGTTAQTLLDLEKDGGEHLTAAHTDDGLRGMRETSHVPEDDILDQSSMAVREADLASAVNEHDAYQDSDIREAAQEAQSNFLRQPPSDTRNHLLPQPLQVDPLMRSPSPGGRVKQLADRYDEIHSLSRQNTMASPTSSTSGRQEYDTSSKQNSLRDSEFERPHLPGEWVSYADTVASEPRNVDEEEEEFDRAETPTPTYEAESAPTPKAEEEPIDFSPLTNKRHLHGATAPEDSENPMAVLAHAGHALANSLMSAVGVQNDDDDTDSDATESLLPSEAPTPDVSGQRFSGFQAQPSPLARADPIAATEKEIKPTPQGAPEEHDVDRHDEPETVSSGTLDRSAEDGSDMEEDVPPPAPLRPHSHIGRPQPSVNTTPQRPIWPSQTSEMSMNWSPDDTENDRLRKEIVQSLSPRPDASRVSMDASSNPRSSTEYPQFSAVQDTTPERKAASTPLHLSPPRAIPKSKEVSPERSSGALLSKPSFLSVQTAQPANMSRESTLLPREYDSYWAERDEQGGDELDSQDTARSTFNPGLGITNVRAEPSFDKSTKEPESAITEPSSAYSERPNYANRAVPSTQPDSASTEPSSPYSARPNYLKKRFSFENDETDDAPPTTDSFIRATEDIAGTAREVHGATGATDVSAPNVDTAPSVHVRDESGSTAATPFVPQGPIEDRTSSNLADETLGRHSAESSAARDSTERVPESATRSINSPDDNLPAINAPATYQYNRPFQQSQDATDTEGHQVGGLRQVSSLSRPVQATRTISSGHFSARGASVSGTETSLPGFKTIAAMRDTPDRIATYEKTREGFANMDTGLNDWLSYMVRINPELGQGIDAPAARTAGGGGFAGSMRHKLTPSIAKLTKPVTGSPTSPSSHPPSSFSAEAPSPLAATRSASSTQRRTPSTSDTSSKGKMFLQSAGQGAKGLFAKGRHKLRGASGEKVDPPAPQRSQYHKPSSTVGRYKTPTEHNDKIEQDEPARKSPTPIWEAFARVRDGQPSMPALPDHDTTVNRAYQGPPLTKEGQDRTSYPRVDSPTEISTPIEVLSAQPVGSSALQASLKPPERTLGATREHNEAHLNPPVVNDRLSQTLHGPLTRLRKDSFAAQTSSDISLPLHSTPSEPERPISPLQAQAAVSPLHLATTTGSIDRSMSSIAREASIERDSAVHADPGYPDQIVSPIESSLDQRPVLGHQNQSPMTAPDAAADEITPASALAPQNEHAEQLAHPTLEPQPGRRSLALEKQQSATITETEIHPALLSRAGSMFGMAAPQDEAATSAVYNASSAGKDASPAGAASTQNRPQPETVDTNTSATTRKTRSKSPFSRWRARSRSRDAQQALGRHDVIDALADSSRPVASEVRDSVHDAASPVPTASSKRRQSPFRHFRQRSRGRSLGGDHVSVSQITDEVNPPMPAQANAPSLGASSRRRQSPFQRFRQRSRGRSLGGLEADHVNFSQNTDEGEPPVPAQASASGRERSQSRNRLRKKSLSAAATDIMPRLSRDESNDKEKEKRRSWYNQFVCYDDDTGRRDSAVLPAARASAVFPPLPGSARSRSRGARESEVSLAEDVNDDMKVQHDTLGNGQQEVGAPTTSQHGIIKSMDQTYNSYRASGVYDPYTTFEPTQGQDSRDQVLSLPTQRIVQERSWATLNHQRHSTSFLEHKEWRKQHGHAHTSSQDPAPSQPRKNRSRAISPFSRGQVPLEREPGSPIPGLPSHLQHLELTHISHHEQTPSQPQKDRTRAVSPFSRGQVPLERVPGSPVPGLPSHLQHLELSLSPPRSAASTPTPAANARSSYPIDTTPASPHPTHPPNNTTATTPIPPTPPHTHERPQSRLSTASQHTHTRAPSLTTSINVNTGNADIYNNDDVPPLPVLPREAVYMQAMGAQFAPNDRSIDVARWRAGVASAADSAAGSEFDAVPAEGAASGTDHARAAGYGSTNVARSSGMTGTQDESKTGNVEREEGWPLKNGVGAGQGVSRHTVRLRDGGERALKKDEEDDDYVVMSPTLDGPGWEWRPDISDVGEGAVRA